VAVSIRSASKLDAVNLNSCVCWIGLILISATTNFKGLHNNVPPATRHRRALPAAIEFAHTGACIHPSTPSLSGSRRRPPTHTLDVGTKRGPHGRDAKSLAPHKSLRLQPAITNPGHDEQSEICCQHDEDARYRHWIRLEICGLTTVAILNLGLFCAVSAVISKNGSHRSGGAGGGRALRRWLLVPRRRRGGIMSLRSSSSRVAAVPALCIKRFGEGLGETTFTNKLLSITHESEGRC